MTSVVRSMQIRAIVAHHDYNHQAHFEIKSENAQAGGADDDGGSAVCCVEKYAADHCPLDRDIELILHTTSAMKDIYRIRLPDVPRSKISNHVRTWMVRHVLLLSTDSTMSGTCNG